MLQIESKEASAILGTVNDGTYYQPQSNSGASPKVEQAFFEEVAGKTKEVTVLSYGKAIRQGRNNAAGIATTDVVWKMDCELETSGQKRSKVRIQLADAVALAKTGNKGTITFGTYKPEGRDTTYLVPVCTTRATALEVAEFIKASVNVTAP